MSWSPQSYYRLSRSERDMRFEDVIGRFLREPDRPLTAASVLEAAGIIDIDLPNFEKSLYWLDVLEPAIISGRKNGAVAPPTRADMIYGIALPANRVVTTGYDFGGTVSVPTAQRRRPRETRNVAVPALAGPRAYFND